MNCTSLSFFFNNTPPTEIYTLSLHDALPISVIHRDGQKSLAKEKVEDPDSAVEKRRLANFWPGDSQDIARSSQEDRKSTRLNSSHRCISYAVFCLKKKKKKRQHINRRKDNKA